MRAEPEAKVVEAPAVKDEVKPIEPPKPEAVEPKKEEVAPDPQPLPTEKPAVEQKLEELPPLPAPADEKPADPAPLTPASDGDGERTSVIAI
ncbi:MAG: hypothetical protein HY075_10160 [Deltaproteobacteria bacterium]|nr:hypothetical protein [Deltaproteobacteria bacterium]